MWYSTPKRKDRMPINPKTPVAFIRSRDDDGVHVSYHDAPRSYSARFFVRDDMPMDVQRDGIHDWVVEHGVTLFDVVEPDDVVAGIVDGVNDLRPPKYVPRKYR